MEEKKSGKNNMVIHLSADKYLISDGLCYWIATKTKRKDKNGNIIAGNKTQKAAIEAGIKKVRIVETTGDELVQ